MKKILLSSVVTVLLLLTGCNEDKKPATEAKAEVAKETITPVLTEKVQEAKEAVVEKAQEVKEATVEKAQEVKEVVAQKAQEVKDSVTAIVEDKKEAVVVTLDGKVLFSTCATCHGQNAEKAALGKSQIIAGWDKQKIVDALHGYKNGTYGGVMKAVMQGQISSKSDAEIDALAGFISTL